MLAPLPAFAQQAAECRPGPEAARVQALRATDGRSLLLSDGREIRLAGLDVPLGTGPGAAAATAALQREAAGRDFDLVPAGPDDRYGRVVAVLYPPGDRGSLQAGLLHAGFARVFGDFGPCTAEWRTAETFARDRAAGLWGMPEHALRRAEAGAALGTQRGQFAVAEGRVLSVRRSAGTIYLNFGRRWRDSLTVTISAPRERMFARAGLEPKALEGRTIRVRGYVEDRNGPLIEALRPEQIEIAGR
ncbi:MAG: thermonuclease family protein [Pseudorhodoplanes sp.]